MIVASSDDEETVAQTFTDHTVEDEESHGSFSAFPVCFGDGEGQDDRDSAFFLSDATYSDLEDSSVNQYFTADDADEVDEDSADDVFQDGLENQSFTDDDADEVDEVARCDFFQGAPIKQSFSDDDDAEVDGDGGDDVEDGSNLFDSMRAICDNGGNLLCCRGPCLRSFHATRKAGEKYESKSLGYTTANVKSIEFFKCNNCLYKQHQCFCCGKLGSFDKSNGAEVYRCVSGTCGHYYHPKCVADFLFPGSEAEALEHRKNIFAGEPFTCPAHRCAICKHVEDREVRDLLFVMCRRCPTSYHRKCLPRRIAFEDIKEENIVQRAWDGLLPHRILIYCLKHQIDEAVRTPMRNHIVFPVKTETLENKKYLVIDEAAQYQITVNSIKEDSKSSRGAKEQVFAENHSSGSQKRRKIKG